MAVGRAGPFCLIQRREEAWGQEFLSTLCKLVVRIAPTLVRFEERGVGIVTVSYTKYEVVVHFVSCLVFELATCSTSRLFPIVILLCRQPIRAF